MYFFAIARATHESPDTRALHKELADILSGYGGLFPGLVDRLGTPNGIVYSPIEDVSIPDCWYRGRVRPPVMAYGRTNGLCVSLDGSGAADFLGQGTCRFALVEARSERAFIQRAEAIGLRYNAPTRIDGYNISQGRAISIAIFRSEGTE